MTIISEEHNQLSFSRRASEVPFRACHVVMVNLLSYTSIKSLLKKGLHISINVSMSNL